MMTNSVATNQSAAVRPNRTWFTVGLIAVLGLAGIGTAAGLHYFAPAKSTATLDPNTIRELLHNPDLSEEDRRALLDKMRATREREMSQRVDEYFAAADDEAKQAVLDKHIDEFQRQQAEREQRRREAEAKREQKRTNPEELSNQQKKERAESGNPDQRAKMMAYFEALRARMTARGIQPPGPGRGGPGGPGGPRGGGRP